nr:DMT family transporter [Chachezhania antarctica]
MLLTGILFVGVTALVKILGQEMPAQQSAFLRYLFGIVFLIPMIRPIRRTTITPRLWKLFIVRGGLHGIGVMLWFYAMSRIPIADVTALNYLSPIYVTIGAAIFLGETLAVRRIIAIVAALIGMVIILRPGAREIEPGHLAMLVTGIVFGASYLLAKITTDETNPAVVVAMLSFWVTVVLAPFAWSVWMPPTWHDIVLLFITAAFATGGHYTMSLALQEAPLNVTQPVTFLQLLWATLLGVVVFGEPLDIWVIVGGVLILGSITYITWREVVIKRRSVTPPPNATKM